jgi:hypothetical protein
LPGVKLKFVNREAELRELDAAARRGGLLVVYGRRRVGKTQLLDCATSSEFCATSSTAIRVWVVHGLSPNLDCTPD